MKKKQQWVKMRTIFLILGLLVLICGKPLAAQTATGTPLIESSSAPPGSSNSLTLSTKVPVTFQLNDSMVKDKVLAGVGIGISASETDDFLVKGETDPAGKFVADLPPGNYFVCYKKQGYVPLAFSPILVDREKPNLITVTLSMMLESIGDVQPRRVQILLNWGSRDEQVKDLDSHLVCSCKQANYHVCFTQKMHHPETHKVDLDVDDTDGGGPETITMIDPPPGFYRYWVHNYGGEAHLGQAEPVVRVIFGDKMVGEFSIASDVTSRVWLPFKGIEIDQMREPKLIAFSSEEFAKKSNVKPPFEQSDRLQEYSPLGNFPLPISISSVSLYEIVLVFFLSLIVIIWLIKRALRP